MKTYIILKDGQEQLSHLPTYPYIGPFSTPRDAAMHLFNLREERRRYGHVVVTAIFCAAVLLAYGGWLYGN